MFKHIFVPTDGSELSQATVKRAVTFAKEAGAGSPPFSPSRTIRSPISARVP